MNVRSGSWYVVVVLLVACLVWAGCSTVTPLGPVSSYDFECLIAGNEIEVKPLNPASFAWMKAEGFVPWTWIDGHRVEIPGLFSPGYRNDVSWLTYTESRGWRASPYCWAIARRYMPQN